MVPPGNVGFGAAGLPSFACDEDEKCVRPAANNAPRARQSARRAFLPRRSSFWCRLHRIRGLCSSRPIASRRRWFVRGPCHQAGSWGRIGTSVLRSVVTVCCWLSPRRHCASAGHQGPQNGPQRLSCGPFAVPSTTNSREQARTADDGPQRFRGYSACSRLFPVLKFIGETGASLGDTRRISLGGRIRGLRRRGGSGRPRLPASGARVTPASGGGLRGVIDQRKWITGFRHERNKETVEQSSGNKHWLISKLSGTGLRALCVPLGRGSSRFVSSSVALLDGVSKGVVESLYAEFGAEDRGQRHLCEKLSRNSELSDDFGRPRCSKAYLRGSCPWFNDIVAKKDIRRA